MIPVVQVASKAQLEAAFRRLPHALLLSGSHGIGLATIARYFSESAKLSLIPVLPEKDEKVDVEKGTITVDVIRRLYDLTRTIEPKGRIILIDYAERMAPAAQNAFLKLLEEPVSNTHFILLSHAPNLFLPTVLSRVQHIEIHPLTQEQSNSVLDALKVDDATRRAQLLFIAEGLPAELTRLARDDKAFEARAAIIKSAREYITGSPYTKLVIAKQYKDSREVALTLLEDALKLLRRTLATNGDTATLRTFERLEVIHGRISRQGNVRLQLSSAVML